MIEFPTPPPESDAAEDIEKLSLTSEEMHLINIGKRRITRSSIATGAGLGTVCVMWFLAFANRDPRDKPNFNTQLIIAACLFTLSLFLTILYSLLNMDECDLCGNPEEHEALTKALLKKNIIDARTDFEKQEALVNQMEHMANEVLVAKNRFFDASKKTLLEANQPQEDDDRKTTITMNTWANEDEDADERNKLIRSYP